MPATSPRKSMDGSKSTSRKKRLEQRQKRPSEKVEEEDEELVDQMAHVDTKDDDKGAPSSSGPAEPPTVAPAEREERTRKVRRNPGPASEYYSRRIYRSVANGEDIDVDKDEPTIPGASRQAAIADSWKQEYSQGTQELASADTIPKMEVVDDDFFLKPKEDYVPPEKLVYCDDQASYYDSRYFEKEDPREPVHYEITAHDIAWMKKLNEHRPLTNGLQYLSLETFYKIMKALEIDAFKNIHNHLLDSLHVVYVRHEDVDAADDTECDVCRVVDCDDPEDMIFCDMCNTCVHLVCAGIQTLPEAGIDYICPKCEITKNPAHPCVLCPALGGSMTYDVTKTKWAHHSCALFIPEIIFENEEHRAPISNFENIAPERFTQLCSICDTRQGACVTCTYQGCEETFHVCCALRAGCSVKIVEMPNNPSGDVYHLAQCHKHSAGREIYLDEKFKSAKNPWLAQIESYFQLMTSYEKLAESLHIEEIIVSDVYEFWKQKRIKKGGPLIPHLHDHISTTPTIERVAQKAAANLEAQHNKAGISIGSLPSVDSPRNYFFRPAALMVTEMRQINLKRAEESIKREAAMFAMIEEREQIKRKSVKEDSQMISVAKEMYKKGTKGTKLLKAFKFSDDEIRDARSDASRKQFIRKLKAYTARPVEVEKQQMSPLKRKMPTERKEPAQAPGVQKSPLTPRNNPNHHPTASTARNLKSPEGPGPSSSGSQNFAVPNLPSTSTPKNRRSQKF